MAARARGSAEAAGATAERFPERFRGEAGRHSDRRRRRYSVKCGAVGALIGESS